MVTRGAVTGILAVRNCWALEPPIGFNFWVQPLLRSPEVTFGSAVTLILPWAEPGTPAPLLWLGSLGTSWGSSRTVPAWGRLCPNDPPWQPCSSALHPRSRGCNSRIANISQPIALGGCVGAGEESAADQIWRELLQKRAALPWNKSLCCALSCSGSNPQP